MLYIIYNNKDIIIYLFIVIYFDIINIFIIKSCKKFFVIKIKGNYFFIISLSYSFVSCIYCLIFLINTLVFVSYFLSEISSILG